MLVTKWTETKEEWLVLSGSLEETGELASQYFDAGAKIQGEETEMPENEFRALSEFGG